MRATSSTTTSSEESTCRRSMGAECRTITTAFTPNAVFVFRTRCVLILEVTPHLNLILVVAVLVRH
jgi:hypothetical protein